MKPQDAVKQFHEAFGLPVFWEPTVPMRSRVVLRHKLLDEEAEEACDELVAFLLSNKLEPSHAKLAKELADLLYVTYGCAHEFGIDLDAVFAKVHASNMSKLGEDGRPVKREDGKILKGPNYRPVDLNTLLEEPHGS